MTRAWNASGLRGLSLYRLRAENPGPRLFESVRQTNPSEIHCHPGSTAAEGSWSGELCREKMRADAILLHLSAANSQALRAVLGSGLSCRLAVRAALFTCPSTEGDKGSPETAWNCGKFWAPPPKWLTAISAQPLNFAVRSFGAAAMSWQWT